MPPGLRFPEWGVPRETPGGGSLRESLTCGVRGEPDGKVFAREAAGRLETAPWITLLFRTTDGGAGAPDVKSVKNFSTCLLTAPLPCGIVGLSLRSGNSVSRVPGASRPSGVVVRKGMRGGFAESAEAEARGAGGGSLAETRTTGTTARAGVPNKE